LNRYQTFTPTWERRRLAGETPALPEDAIGPANLRSQAKSVEV